jgi:hypothetical protein
MAQDFERVYASSISNNSGSPTSILTSNSDDSGSKIVIQTGDVVKAFSDTASAIDVLISFVDTISS